MFDFKLFVLIIVRCFGDCFKSVNYNVRIRWLHARMYMYMYMYIYHQLRLSSLHYADVIFDQRDVYVHT